DPSHHALPGVCGDGDPIRLWHGGAGDEAAGRQLDSDDTPVDDGAMDVSGCGNSAGWPLGVQRAGMGWLLGVGPRRERLPSSMAGRNGFFHSVMVQERRGMLKVWNVVLVIVTFWLSIFG